ncbi:hypothetical protein SCHPADRAFT_897023 [Schizopora paradoxa]|uniref:Uncharacterized protein n=1 Tax=Schizopora paradoxa TaxID=27342 RepID=A0A0H2R4T1_9AGAM|nr:hypothetical protein SCHPADRAFT_897023 [Schizopora paradoxa]
MRPRHEKTKASVPSSAKLGEARRGTSEARKMSCPYRVSVILCARTYAVWKGNKHVLALFVGTCTIAAAGAAYTVYRFVHGASVLEFRPWPDNTIYYSLIGSVLLDSHAVALCFLLYKSVLHTKAIKNKYEPDDSDSSRCSSAQCCIQNVLCARLLFHMQTARRHGLGLSTISNIHSDIRFADFEMTAVRRIGADISGSHVEDMRNSIGLSQSRDLEFIKDEACGFPLQLTWFAGKTLDDAPYMLLPPERRVRNGSQPSSIRHHEDDGEDAELQNALNPHNPMLEYWDRIRAGCVQARCSPVSADGEQIVQDVSTIDDDHVDPSKVTLIPRDFELHFSLPRKRPVKILISFEILDLKRELDAERRWWKRCKSRSPIETRTMKSAHGPSTKTRFFSPTTLTAKSLFIHAQSPFPLVPLPASEDAIGQLQQSYSSGLSQVQDDVVKDSHLQTFRLHFRAIPAFCALFFLHLRDESAPGRQTAAIQTQNGGFSSRLKITPTLQITDSSTSKRQHLRSGYASSDDGGSLGI